LGCRLRRVVVCITVCNLPGLILPAKITPANDLRCPFGWKGKPSLNSTNYVALEKVLALVGITAQRASFIGIK